MAKTKSPMAGAKKVMQRMGKMAAPMMGASGAPAMPAGATPGFKKGGKVKKGY